MYLEKKLEQQAIQVSVPCRIDFGGTLDISTIYLPLLDKHPSSFNIALDLRTFVTLKPWKKRIVKISSKGFESAQFEYENAPFHHPMGLMFAVAKYFNAHGVHIHIESSSPPRSALGGSSSAAVAMAAALCQVQEKKIDLSQIAWLVHYIEASVAGVPCGVQDQLAAAFGGVNQWMWKMGKISPEFEQRVIYEDENDIEALNSNILIAYCGIPHVSKDINGQWISSFVNGQTRHVFGEICDLTQKFSSAIQHKDFEKAARLMNRETQLRCDMTPEVLDITGKKLFEKAVDFNCGARFTGAGGGGCLWAVGEKSDIRNLKAVWQDILESIEDAAILDAKIETKGIMIH